jgi:hypothetical protein
VFMVLNVQILKPMTESVKYFESTKIFEKYYFIRNFFMYCGKEISEYTASHPRRQYSSQSPSWKPQV